MRRLRLVLRRGRGVELWDGGQKIAEHLTVLELTTFFIEGARQVSEWTARTVAPVAGFGRLLVSALKSARKVA
jgi:hypothetical protein